MTFDGWITAKKMVYQGAFVFLSGGLTALINFFQTQPPEMNAATFGVFMILLKGAENYLKHRDDD